MVFNLYLNEPNYKSKIVNTQSANALPKTNTSTSSIIKTATTLPLPANHGSTNRLLALKTNALASEKKSLANTWTIVENKSLPLFCFFKRFLKNFILVPKL